MEFPEGWGGPLCEPILENPEGMGGHRKNPFRGGVWIFSGTAHCQLEDEENIMSKTFLFHFVSHFFWHF